MGTVSIAGSPALPNAKISIGPGKKWKMTEKLRNREGLNVVAFILHIYCAANFICEQIDRGFSYQKKKKDR